MFKRLFQRKPQEIVVVSGLPRSGTSMMMKMLEAGGIAPLQDGVRSADSDNPKGYYEFERVKALDKGDTAWLPDATGKAVKIISALLTHLPEGYSYKVLFMRRNLDEVLASQTKMLDHRNEEQRIEDTRMKDLYRKHLRQVDTWMAQQDNVQVLDVDYRQLVNAPLEVLPSVVRFLGRDMDATVMAGIVDPGLYRNRS